MAVDIAKLKIESTAFRNMAAIPKKYTCEGEDLSPPLTLSGIPSNARSVAIIVDDPDAPMGVFVHWVAWNLDPKVTHLDEGAKVPNEGVNGFRQNRYRGPCPPPGKPHRYFFKVYALDTSLNLPARATKTELLNAMNGHIVAQGELVGTFERK